MVESTLTRHPMRLAASPNTCSIFKINAHTLARCQQQNSPYTVCEHP